MVTGLTLVAIALFLQTRIDVGHRLRAAAARPSCSWASAWRFVMSPDVHRGDERGERRQGRRGLRDPLDEPDGGRHLRRGGDRRAVPAPGPNRACETRWPAPARPRRSASAIVENLGSRRQRRRCAASTRPSRTRSERRGAGRLHPRAVERHVALGERGGRRAPWSPSASIAPKRASSAARRRQPRPARTPLGARSLRSARAPGTIPAAASDREDRWPRST